jgi:Transposase IS66 family
VPCSHNDLNAHRLQPNRPRTSAAKWLRHSRSFPNNHTKTPLAPRQRSFDELHSHIVAAKRIHADDTTMPILAKGTMQTGRLWIYVRDDPPFVAACSGGRHSTSGRYS